MGVNNTGTYLLQVGKSDLWNSPSHETSEKYLGVNSLLMAIEANFIVRFMKYSEDWERTRSSLRLRTGQGIIREWCMIASFQIKTMLCTSL